MHVTELFRSRGRPRGVGRLFFCLILAALLFAPAHALTPAERGAIWARTWELVRERFVDPDAMSRVHWESEFQSHLFELEKAPNDVEFWRSLRILVCKLENGRTQLKFPGNLPRLYDLVPIRMSLVGEKVFVERLSSSPEVQNSGIRPGDELLSVDGKPVMELLRTECLDHVAGSRPAARLVSAVSRVLTGPGESRANLRLKRPDGHEYSVQLTRTSGPDNKYFRDLGEPVRDEVKVLDGQYAYVNAGYNFVWNLEQVIARVLDDQPLEALILDLRETESGIVSDYVLSRLGLFPLPANAHRRVAWTEVAGKLQPGANEWQRGWDTLSARIILPDSNVFRGSVIVLISPLTSGPAEQFIEPLVFAKRVTLVGDTTAGAGHAHTVLPLGEGAMLSVAISDPLWEGGLGDGIGFAPDIPIRPTAQGIAAGKDEVLERALSEARKK